MRSVVRSIGSGRQKRSMVFLHHTFPNPVKVTTISGTWTLSCTTERVTSVEGPPMTIQMCMNTALTKAELGTHLDGWYFGFMCEFGIDIFCLLRRRFSLVWLRKGNSIGESVPIHDIWAFVRIFQDKVLGAVATNHQLSRNARFTMSNHKFGSFPLFTLYQLILSP